MKKFMFAALAATAVAAAPASAADFLLTYTATNAAAPLTASMRITTANTLNAVGGYDVLGIRGNVAGDIIAALTPNPAQPNVSGSADGLFTYDNVYFPAGAPGTSGVVSNPGLLFTSATHEYNFFSDSATQYELYQATPGQGYTANSVGTLSVLAVPEPAQWALMLGGFGLAGVSMRRRRKAATTVYA